MNLSLTARISLLFAAGAASVLLILGWVVARSVEAHFEEMDRHELMGKLTLARNLIARVEDADALAELPGRLDDALMGHHGLALSVQPLDGRPSIHAGDGRVPEALLRPADESGSRLRTGNDSGRVWRGLSADVESGIAGDAPYRIAIALDITHHQHFMHEFHRTLALAVALAALFTAGLGWAATRAGLEPLRRMTALTDGLSASRLTERLAEAPLPGEMRALAAAFNTMLARLEDSFTRLSEFSADLAHELRTPLSNLITQTQVGLSRARTTEEYRELLGSNLEECERLARMVGDLLFLAQADNRQLAPRREEIDLAAELTGLCEFYEALASDRGVRLVRTGMAQVRADRDMLRRALANLISNALRHTGAGGAIRLNLSHAPDWVRIEVANPGAIPDKHLPRLFERFYTGDPARRTRGEGAGLGLAIARSIARMHGGDLTARNADGEARFTLSLPA